VVLLRKFLGGFFRSLTRWLLNVREPGRELHHSAGHHLCVQALEQRRVTEARWRLATGEAWAGSGLVLTTRLGDPLDPLNFHRYFKARAEKAGVPVISVHSTRRTCASLLVALDVHPRVAMAILRHSQIAVTMDIYSQVSSTSTREALKRLGSQLGEGSL
jgi:integrase